MPSPSPELLILRHLAARTHASAVDTGAACRLPAAEILSRLARLESLRYVTGRTDARLVPPARAFAITGEGRRKAETS